MKIANLSGGLFFTMLMFVGIFTCVWSCLPVFRRGPCGEPPIAIVASKINIDAALRASVANIKGSHSVEVTELIPEKARTAEVVNYLTCKAKEEGLVTTQEEIQKHKELLGFLTTNPTASEYTDFLAKQRSEKTDPTPIKHENLFKSIRIHFEKHVPRAVFDLVIPQPPSEQLDRFWVGEINEKTWADFFAKLCRMHAACLECTPSPDEITTNVRIRISGPLREDVTAQGTKIYKCAAAN
jgi:hypothetical protein